MVKRTLLIVSLLLSGLSFVGAQNACFQSSVLVDIGKGIDYVPDATKPAGTYNAGNYWGLPLTVEYDCRHTVTHLGFRLFSDDMKKEYASDVYNFLERYFLELCTWTGKNTVQQKLKDDKVMFTTGGIADVKRITPATAFSISRVENKFYEVEWSDNGQVFLSMAFPVQYELLLGMPQNEIEKTIYDQITGAPDTNEFLSGTVSDYELISGNVYRSNPAKYYELESLTTARYYYRQGQAYTLICDTVNDEYTAANVLKELSLCNNPMLVEQSVYGFKKQEYTITLRQWLNYCRQEGLTIYSAVEKEYEDGYKMLVVAENKDLGYNHLLSILMPRSIVSKPKEMLKVELNAFIPTHNVKNLYHQQSSKGKKKI